MTSAPQLQMETVAGSPERLFSAWKERPCSFWLDSSPGSDAVSRWSYLGADPFLVIDGRDGITRIAREGFIAAEDGDPLDILTRLLEDYAIAPVPGAPPFIGGGVGWLGYDLVRAWEPLPSRAIDDSRLPWLRIAFHSTIYAYRHPNGPLLRLRRGDIDESPLSPDLLHRLDRIDQSGPPIGSRGEREPTSWAGRVEDSLPLEAYRDAVHRIQDYITEGDIYQANLTRRWSHRYDGDLPRLYLALRAANPAPFGAWLRSGDTTVLSASPERFLLHDAATRRVETRPIKGTRPRAADPAEDRRLAGELIESEKDRAENLMIVDVHRNDLGRVCEVGSVKVTTLRGLESYATVHHLVSVVEGRRRAASHPIDLVRAAFPAGSITGAPKLRAMEIIDEIEPVRRGIYTGSLGYFGWDGSFDLSVVIRTFIAKDGWLHCGVGGGVVADSDADAEWRESIDKARGMVCAIESVSDKTTAPKGERSES